MIVRDFMLSLPVFWSGWSSLSLSGSKLFGPPEPWGMTFLSCYCRYWASSFSRAYYCIYWIYDMLMVPAPIKLSPGFELRVSEIWCGRDRLAEGILLTLLLTLFWALDCLGGLFFLLYIVETAGFCYWMDGGRWGTRSSSTLLKPFSRMSCCASRSPLRWTLIASRPSVL